MAAALGFESKPIPGTLSNGEASPDSLELYGAGFRFGSGAGPSSFRLARTSSASGVVAATTRTPIWSGSVHPAAS